MDDYGTNCDSIWSGRVSATGTQSFLTMLRECRLFGKRELGLARQMFGRDEDPAGRDDLRAALVGAELLTLWQFDSDFSEGVC